MDVLADLLDRAHARGGAFGRTVLTPKWGVRFAAELPLSVHAVLSGEALVRSGTAQVRVMAGDIAIVRGQGAAGPELAGTERDARVLPLPEALARFGTPDRELIFPGEPSGKLICGAYSFTGDLCSGLIAALPPVVQLRPGAGSLRALLGLLADELTRPGPGQQVILDRFLDLILVHALRGYYARPDASVPGWYRALGDPAIAAALTAMHERPADPWTVDTLARTAGMSRSAFSRRFGALTGEPPLTYLTRWRISLARERLRDRDVSLAQVAREAGYGSEFAFSAAFRRHTGQPPGRWRTAATRDDRLATMTNPPARTAAERKQDTLTRLEHDEDAWVATADPETGIAGLVPLSFLWDGTEIIVSTVGSNPASRNMQATGQVRLGIGLTRDVVLIEGSARVAELDDQAKDAFAVKTGFDPRELRGYLYFRIRPLSVQAWREVNELKDRDLMTDGAWLI